MENKILDQFHPAFRFKLERILDDLKNLGWEPIIASGMRTPAQQAEKVKQGYSKTMRSWHVASTMATLPAGRNSLDVVHGNAADIVDRRYGWAGPAAQSSFQFWKDLGRIAKKHGCYWGGDWKMKDVAHIYMLFVEMAPQSTAIS